MKQILMGTAVVVMAFSLSKPWMIVVQAIAGAFLLTIGLIKVFHKRQSDAP